MGHEISDECRRIRDGEIEGSVTTDEGTKRISGGQRKQ